MQLLKMTEAEKCTLSVAVANGTATEPPTWTDSAAGIVSLFPAADGMSCDVNGFKAGVLTVTVSVKVPAGAGFKTISVTINVEIDAAPSLAVTLGPIVEQ
jgi:hypothetical protein